jgi:hypothetical protein
MENLAPIVLFVYNRISHTKKTVDALKKNDLARDSHLIVVSDGAKSENEMNPVQDVREFIKTIKGFKSINIIERDRNFGLSASVIDGINQVLKLYDRIIAIEDDVITAPTFLSFINKSLEYYQKNKSIFSVSGYPYPIGIPGLYNKDVFISYRASSWGWGTWKDRWEKVDWEVKDFSRFIKDEDAQKLFNRAGEDSTPMLKAQMLGKIDSWAIRWSYSHFKNKAYCLLPTKPLCKNIGTDNSGTHSTKSDKFDVDLSDNADAIQLTDELEINDEIMKNLQKFMLPSVVRRIINKFKY